MKKEAISPLFFVVVVVQVNDQFFSVLFSI